MKTLILQYLVKAALYLVEHPDQLKEIVDAIHILKNPAPPAPKA